MYRFKNVYMHVVSCLTLKFSLRLGGAYLRSHSMTVIISHCSRLLQLLCKYLHSWWWRNSKIDHLAPRTAPVSPLTERCESRKKKASSTSITHSHLPPPAKSLSPIFLHFLSFQTQFFSSLHYYRFSWKKSPLTGSKQSKCKLKNAYEYYLSFMYSSLCKSINK